MSNLLGLEEEKPAGAGPQYNSVDAGPDPNWIAATKRGANWFYWIAGLSVINSALFIGGANVHFLAGLGITELVDAIVGVAIQQGAPSIFKAVSVVIDLVFVAGFALCGYYANKLFRTAFIIGIVVYAIDVLIVLLIGDLFMLAFHAFAGYSLIRGLIASGHIRSYKPMTPVPGAAPPVE